MRAKFLTVPNARRWEQARIKDVGNREGGGVEMIGIHLYPLKSDLSPPPMYATGEEEGVQSRIHTGLIIVIFNANIKRKQYEKKNRSFFKSDIIECFNQIK